MRGLIPARRHTAPPRRQGGGDRRVSGADSEGRAQGLAELRGDVLTQSGPRSGDPRRSGSQTRVGLQPTLARLSEEASEESDENHARPDLQYSQAGDAIGAEASQDSAELRCPENGAGGDGQEAMRSREEVEWRVRQRGRTGSEPGGPRRATADGRGQRQISMDALRAGAARQVASDWGREQGLGSNADRESTQLRVDLEVERRVNAHLQSMLALSGSQAGGPNPALQGSQADAARGLSAATDTQDRLLYLLEPPGPQEISQAGDLRLLHANLQAQSPAASEKQASPHPRRLLRPGSLQACRPAGPGERPRRLSHPTLPSQWVAPDLARPQQVSQSIHDTLQDGSCGLAAGPGLSLTVEPALASEPDESNPLSSSITADGSGTSDGLAEPSGREATSLGGGLRSTACWPACAQEF
ncbi:hypothetical protein WJX84_006569 [Apatococcus fuscideae]|uniref:Uncharacterized protein n=1 Tax=Apatococcus fuscideae TaxID=2026836 RepID=A0AAW1TCY3_9CHLO